MRAPGPALYKTRMDAAAQVVDEQRRRRRIGLWMAAVAVPLGLFVVLLWRPSVDRIWESHPAHFWLVLLAAAASFGPIARAASRPLAPSGSSSWEESGRTTFIAAENRARPRAPEL